MAAIIGSCFVNTVAESSEQSSDCVFDVVHSTGVGDLTDTVWLSFGPSSLCSEVDDPIIERPTANDGFNLSGADGIRRDADQHHGRIAIHREACGRTDIRVAFGCGHRCLRSPGQTRDTEMLGSDGAFTTVDIDSALGQKTLIDASGVAICKVQVGIEHDQRCRQGVVSGILEADADCRDGVADGEPVVQCVLALGLQIQDRLLQREAAYCHADEPLVWPVPARSA